MKNMFAQILVGIVTVAWPAPVAGFVVEISLKPGDQEGYVVADVVASGRAFASPALSGFAVTLGYDPAIVSPVGVTFSNYLDLGILGSTQFSPFLPINEAWSELWPDWRQMRETAGRVHLIEASSETPADLIAAQPGSFSLATVLFEVLAPGDSKIDFRYLSWDEVVEGNPPVIVCPPDLTVPSFSHIPAPDFAGGSVSDESDPDPQVWHAEDWHGSSFGRIIRTYVARNASGIRASCTQTITVQPRPGDLNTDGLRDRADLDLLMTQIRQHSSNSLYDLNGDGKVDIADARHFVVHFMGQ